MFLQDREKIKIYNLEKHAKNHTSQDLVRNIVSKMFCKKKLWKKNFFNINTTILKNWVSKYTEKTYIYLNI